MTRFRISLSAGGMIGAIFVGQALGMSGIVSFPALLPQFQRLWSLTDSGAGVISGIYFAGYIVAVPLLSALTDRIDPRRIYVASLLGGVVSALGFALFANGAPSACLWRFLQGAAFGGAHMPGMRALSDAVPAPKQMRSIAVYTATFTVGVSLSYALSGLLAGALGWRFGLALLATGPLAAAAIGWGVLPPLPRAAVPRSLQASRWPSALAPILRNRQALLYVCAYGLHNGEVSAIRAWMVALLVFAADQAGRAELAAYATLVAMVANLCGTPLIVAVNELAARRDRQAVIAATMTVSAVAGLVFAAAAALSPVVAALAAILCVAAATADAGTINAGLVGASEPERRGVFLGVQALSGFGASAVTPILFGLVLDLAGGGRSETAWIAGFAAQAAFGAIWPLAYLRRRIRARRAVWSRNE